MIKVRKFLSDNLGFFLVAIANLVYILSAIYGIVPTEKTIAQILGDGLITYILSTFILISMRLQGIKMGSNSDEVINTENALGNIVEEINPNIEKLDVWCEIQNSTDLKKERSIILGNACLKYEECFDENGIAKEFMVIEPSKKDKIAHSNWKKKYRAYKKAVKKKINPLTSTNLTLCNNKSLDPHDFGRTKTEYQTRENIKSMIVKIAIALIVGLFMPKLLNFEDPSKLKAELLWKALQVALYILIGGVQLVKAYMYMTDEYRNGIVKKIRFLTMFKNYLGVNDNGIKDER